MPEPNMFKSPLPGLIYSSTPLFEMISPFSLQPELLTSLVVWRWLWLRRSHLNLNHTIHIYLHAMSIQRDRGVYGVFWCRTCPCVLFLNLTENCQYHFFNFIPLFLSPSTSLIGFILWKCSSTLLWTLLKHSIYIFKFFIWRSTEKHCLLGRGQRTKWLRYERQGVLYNIFIVTIIIIQIFHFD